MCMPDCQVESTSDSSDYICDPHCSLNLENLSTETSQPESYQITESKVKIVDVDISWYVLEIERDKIVVKTGAHPK
jgi:hypothetical protein